MSQLKRNSQGIAVGRKSLVVKVRMGDGSTMYRYARAPAGRLLGPEAVDSILEKLAGQMEREFPEKEFRLVELRGGDFNFVEVEREEEAVSSQPSAIRDPMYALTKP